jgi:lysophospholipase L1-like esterase
METLRRARETLLIVAITAALLAAVGLADLLFAYGSHASAGEDSRSQADTYGGAGWVAGYFREFGAAQTDWAAYVQWRWHPQQGEYINVDGRGLRRTWRAPATGTGAAPAGGARQRRIFFFGGSTLWGTGARDDYTIPSLFAKAAAAAGQPVAVTNFGMTGYVSTQEEIALLLELQRGNIPDAVVFYDGVNDIYSTYQNQRAGLPENEGHRRAEFNLASPWLASGERWSRILPLLVGNTALLRHLFPRGETPIPLLSPARLTALAEETLAVYAANVRLVALLAREYGFQAHFFWQPVISTKGHLTAYERFQRVGVPEAVHTMYREADARIGTVIQSPHFHNLGGLLATSTAPYFIDFCHLGESGNQVVAQAMWAALRHAP